MKRIAALGIDIYWLGLLLFALCYWLLFYVGTGSAESLDLSKTSWQIASEFRQIGSNLLGGNFGVVISLLSALRAEMGVINLINYFPLAILYTVFGPGELVNQAVSLGTALISLIFIYRFTNRRFGKVATFVASVFWVAMPFNTMTATTLGGHTLPFLASLVGFFALENLFTRGSQEMFFFSAGIFLVVSVFDLWMGTAFFVYVVLRRFVKRLNRDLTGIIGAGLALVLVGFFMVGIGGSFFEFYSFLVALPGVSLLLVLAFAAIYRSNKEDFTSLSPILIPLIGMILAAATGTLSSTTFLIYLLPLLAILASLVGKLFSPSQDAALYSWGLTIAAGFVLVLIYTATRAQQNLIPVDGDHLLTWDAELFYLFRIVAGFVLLFALAISAVKGRWVQLISSRNQVILLVAISLAWVPSSWDLTKEARGRNIAAREVLSRIADEKTSLPVLVAGDEMLFEHLRFIEGFDSLESIEIGSLSLDRTDQTDNAYLVFWDFDLSNIERSGYLLGYIGQSGQDRLSIMRVLDTELAKEELRQSAIELAQGPNLKAFEQEFAALVNLGRICEGLHTYLLNVTSNELLYEPQMLVVPGAKLCFDHQVENRVDLMLEPSSYFPVLKTADEVKATSETPYFIRTSVKYTYFADPRKARIQMEVEPNSVYFFQATVRTSEPVMALYWNYAGIQDYAFAGKFEEFVDIGVFIITPPSGLAEQITISPFLFDNYGNHDISLLAFSKINFFEGWSFSGEELFQGPGD